MAWAGRRHGLALVAGIAAWQLWLMVVRDPGMFGLSGLPGWTRRPHRPSSPTRWPTGVYFPLGLVMSLHGAAVKPHLERWRGAAALAAAALLGLGLLNAGAVVSAPWARLLAPLPLMFVLPTIDRAAIPKLAWFERLGRRSYGVYLSHFFIINAAVMGLAAWPAAWRLPALVYPALLLVALGGALALMDGLARIEPGRKVYRHLFGIVPPPSSSRVPAPRASALHP